MSNREKLKNLLIDVFLLTPEEFSFDLTVENIDTWDSLGVVAMAVGVQVRVRRRRALITDSPLVEKRLVLMSIS